MPVGCDALAVTDEALAESCFAREAAVGAVRCDGRLMGLVGSRFFGTCELDDFDSDLSTPNPVRAIEAAVGAVSELLLAFFVGILVAGGVFG